MLTIDKMSKLTSIYQKKGWSIDETFNYFCEMLANYSDDEQNLILALTEDFLWIRFEQYPFLLDNVINKMLNDFKNREKDNIKIYLYPMLTEEDKSKTKSAVFLHYLLKGNVPKYQQLFSHDKITLIFAETPANIGQYATNKYICFIDDYIGSGMTANQVIDIWGNKGWEHSNIITLSLVAQQIGISNLSSMYNYTSEIRKRGITDNSFCTTNDILQMKQIMQEIENKIGVTDVYKFGWQRSEALIKMHRTPNNTFPVFWLTSTHSKSVPFARG